MIARSFPYRIVVRSTNPTFVKNVIRQPPIAQRYQPYFGEEDTVYLHSSYVKGVIGESAMAKAITIACPDWDVRDRSSAPRESDIHATDVCRTGKMVAFECKNKAVITKRDIVKSIRDIRSLKAKYGNQFAGYMFVSLRSSNIPLDRKFCEIIDDIPTIWLGTEGHMHQTIPGIISALSRVITTEPNVDMVAYKMNRIHDSIRSNKKEIDKAVTDVTTLLERIKELEDANHCLWRSIRDVVPE